MKNFKQFFTPEHPRFRRWGGASPMLARELSNKALETSYDKLTRSEVMRIWKKADMSDSWGHDDSEHYVKPRSSISMALGNASPRVWLKKLPSFLSREKKSESRMGSPMKPDHHKSKPKSYNTNHFCPGRKSFSDQRTLSAQMSNSSFHATNPKSYNTDNFFAARKSFSDQNHFCAGRNSFPDQTTLSAQMSSSKSHANSRQYNHGSSIFKGSKQLRKHEAFKKASTSSFLCASAFAPIITAVPVF